MWQKKSLNARALCRPTRRTSDWLQNRSKLRSSQSRQISFIPSHLATGTLKYTGLTQAVGRHLQNTKEKHGKVSPNEIISLLDVNLKFNLAESTATNLTFGKIADEVFLSELKKLELGYGTSRGYEPLRNEIASRTATSADKVMITNGAAGSIFLTAFSLCNLGDEVVTVVPNFPPTMDIISAVGATKKNASAILR